MLDLGQPMHAFDASRVANAGIVVRTAKTDEEFVTLDGEKSYYGERESSKYQNQTGATESKIHQNF